ncbi:MULTISPECIES: chemotaxis protein CheD [Kyrpidia]|uniref:Sequence specific deamidase required for methylation of methyl-accepting chemotaxis proteins (MCPs) by CheR n=2 Tax=Kyrpidia spormannii TaxID=2055160 RepID=A0ACA8Z8W6_9BACL|nr:MULTISPECIES: chemotaxis protein CheD [Kyrpidia]MCL6574739.1 chemotaxis protein CheD [Kyrpidia sp.]CAB3392470.1 sequence specific deamidase required for methylation of methyl-accepting chemotaxis proteins (MCPs) by CheR [Kyrpidia spormannii]CAB3393394.1 sequence specific deamidase required for methylation of methyl-accepting chemotaxis proteins (MCPs) by CheR [Kyrpidia spormannii]
MIAGQVVHVGMADLKVVHCPDRLRSVGLGSCVGVALWDPQTKVAGLVHIMLPSAEGFTDATRAKFADTGVDWLVEMMQQNGARVERLRAKMAGGAQMFTFAGKNDLLKIGPRNVDACRRALAKWGIPMVGEDVGGSTGRTIELHSEDGRLWVRTVRGGQIVL